MIEGSSGPRPGFGQDVGQIETLTMTKPTPTHVESSGCAACGLDPHVPGRGRPGEADRVWPRQTAPGAFAVPGARGAAGRPAERGSVALARSGGGFRGGSGAGSGGSGAGSGGSEPSPTPRLPRDRWTWTYRWVRSLPWSSRPDLDRPGCRVELPPWSIGERSGVVELGNLVVLAWEARNWCGWGGNHRPRPKTTVSNMPLTDPLAYGPSKYRPHERAKALERWLSHRRKTGWTPTRP